MVIKQFLANLLLILISVLIALVASEVFLRLFYPQNLGVWSITRDGITIHLLNTTRYLPQFNQEVRINSLAMRDSEHTVEKEEGIFRILILGDSFMEAFQVPFEESFPSLLEKNLQMITHIPIEVINASVSGWGTDDELTYLIRYGVAFKPDLILIAMTLHNDVSDNLLQEFHFLNEGQLHERPLQEIPFAEYLTLEIKGLLAAHSHLYQLFRHYWRSNDVRVTARLLDRHVAELIRASPRDEVKQGWELTRQLLRKVKSIGRQIGAQTAVFLIPLTMQLSDEKLSAFLASQKLTKGEILLHQPQTLMNKIGAEEDIEIIDLLPGFWQWMQSNQGERELYLEADGHWNEGGHALAATIAAEELLRRNLIGHTSCSAPRILARGQAWVDM